MASPSAVPGTPVALVTGAAGGLGRAAVAKLRERGMRVFAADRALAEIPCGAPVGVMSVDVTDEAAIHACIERVLSEWGRLDHVVHLAGCAGAGPLTAVTRDEWQRVLDTNLTSAFLLAKAAYEALSATRGSLVLTASTNGLNGGSALSGPAYAVAKEWAPAGIRVNCLAPGPIDTPMVTGRFSSEVLTNLRASVPLGRIGDPKDVAHAIDYLTSPAASFVTGTVMNLSGGLVLD
jgi:3-oxoacyl-[acyl-carrier protein] reductase